MRCNDIARVRGEGGKRGRYQSIDEDACCVAYTTSIFIHQPRLRFSSSEEDSGCGFPRHQNARCTVANRGCRSREKFSCRCNAAIRHRDSVKSNVENAFTRDRVRSSHGFAPPSPESRLGKRFRFAWHRARVITIHGRSRPFHSITYKHRYASFDL